MNKFKIGDRVKVDSELADLFGEGNIGIITDIELRINDAKTELYKVYHIEDKEIDFYAQNLELVETIEEIAVNKFKEELKNKVKIFYSNLKIENNKYYKQSCLAHTAKLYKIEDEEQRFLKLLESEDK